MGRIIRRLLIWRIVLVAAALPASLAGATATAVAADGSAAAPRIVNPDGAGAVPFQVALVQIGDNGSVSLPLDVFCGGTVRDATHIITAAHCVADENAGQIEVVAGFVSRSNPGADEMRPVAAVSTSPLYDETAHTHDVAVLTLATPLLLNAAVAPLPVVSAAGPDVGSKALISGWGYLDANSDGDSRSDTLRYALINVDDPSACGNYGDTFIPDQMLCAGRNDPAATVDTCSGDSGGPLARYDGTPSGPDGSFTPADFDALIGIVSFGRGCADPDYPGIYTRLSTPDNNARATDPNPPPRVEPTAEPAVVGTAADGQTLSCQPGRWSDPSADLQIRWLSASVDPQGQASDLRAESDGPTLPLTDALLGRDVTCEVRASNAGGWRVLDARPVGPISATAGVAPAPSAEPAPSLARPTAQITRRACANRRCHLTIVARGAGADAVRATATVRRLTHCPAAHGCAASRRLTVHRASAGIFTVTSPRLAPGRYRFTVVATSAAGLAAAPVSAVLAVGRR